MRRKPVDSPQQIRQLTAFFAWSSWAASARRPGHNYSYTNNWPPEDQVGNAPSADVLVWSVISLIALLGGIGILFAAFGRWRLGWQGREQATLSFRSPGDVALTPAQRATAWFFFVMAALFLLQTLVGAASQHYRAELDGFFGIDIARVFPYNLVRTWHVQLAIFFVSTSFVAAGIFLAPMIAGREPRGQSKLAFVLLGALAVVVFGSLIGEFADIHNWFQGSIFGDQGFEYLDLGRFWQVLLVIGLCLWIVILFRGLRGRLRKERVGNMPWLFFLAALAIPAFYAVGLLVNANAALHDHRLLALLGRPPLGGGLPGAVHHRDGRLYLRAARGGSRAGGAAGDLPRHHPLLGRRRDRDHAPPLLLGRAGRAHGAGGGLLRHGGDAADLSHGRGLELPPARGRGRSRGRQPPSRTAGR